jgi:hypothetical protein
MFPANGDMSRHADTRKAETITALQNIAGNKTGSVLEISGVWTRKDLAYATEYVIPGGFLIINGDADWISRYLGPLGWELWDVKIDGSNVFRRSA